MKNLLFFITLISLTIIPKPVNYILIQHIGYSDKPILNILINAGDSIKSSDNKTKQFFVTQKDFNSVEKTIIAFQNNNKATTDYGSFNVTIFQNSIKTGDFNLTKQKSVKVLTAIIDSLKGHSQNKLLLDRLEITKKRIDF